MEDNTIHIEHIASDRYYDHFCVTGLSVEEMDYVLNGNGNGTTRRDDRLVEVMSKYRNDSTYGQNIAEGWRWGYGIYSIRHVGEHLMVEVGNNCD